MGISRNYNHVIKNTHTHWTLHWETGGAGFYLSVAPTLTHLCSCPFSLRNFHHHNPKLSHSHTHLKGSPVGGGEQDQAPPWSPGNSITLGLGKH